MKQSAEHSKPVFVGGFWYCDECGAETSDFELFEDSGRYEDCVSRAVKEEAAEKANDVVAWADVERVRVHMDEVRGSFKRLGEAASEVEKKFSDLGTSMTININKEIDENTYRMLAGLPPREKR